jgi:hypothetical protein
MRRRAVVTNPDMGTISRNMKVPERTAGSQEVRNYLISYIERATVSPSPQNSTS